MRKDLVRQARQLLLLIIALAILAEGWFAWQTARSGGGPAWLQTLFGFPQTLAGWRIGIVAGHNGNDSGAVCPDGLTEASVNLAVAEAAVRGLKQRGATVDLLEEFDSRLSGYQADVFISIHADSCEVDLSGFKVASLEGGSVASERLVACLWNRYAAVTGLQPHPDTVTYDMRGYHAFREIASGTPAAIIETGFLKGDRDLLTRRPDRVAAGIVAGVECFGAAR
jgi:N-acetylmuramoyl-L-alanine amidase